MYGKVLRVPYLVVQVGQVGRMTARTWLVRRSRFPFDVPGAHLGVVVARDYESAYALAALDFARPFTVEPSPSSDAFAAKIARAVASKARRPMRRYDR